MLLHYLGRGTPEYHMSGEHLPKRRAERVQIRADVDPDSGELLRTRELGGTSKRSGH
jgi:hypothetical protein